MSIDNTHRLHQGEIMVVEDNPPDLRFLSEILKKAGYQVRPASDGELALRSVRAKQPDLILLDINLPDMTGVEVCNRLKADHETKEIPVIFISALGETDLKVKALEGGGVDYITKPIEPSEVLARINTHIEIHRLQQHLVFQSEKLIAEIDERKRTEKALRESKDQYQFLADNMNDGIASIDENGVFTYANDKYCELVGYPYSEIIGKNWITIFDQNAQNTITEQLAKRLKGISDAYEVENIRKDGKKVYLRISAAPIFTEEGGTKGSMGIASDITMQKQAEKELQKRTRDLGERVKELNCLYGISYLVEKSNISLEEIFQGSINIIPASWQYPEITCARLTIGDEAYQTENFKETDWKQSAEFFVHGNRMGVLDIFYLEKKPEFYEGPFLKEERRLINAIAERLGKIFERKQSEAALFESEEKYRSMMEAMKDSVYICTSDFHITYMNPAMVERIGPDATDELCYKAIYNKDEKCPWCVHDQVMQGKSIETEIVNAKDDRRYTCSNSPIFHIDGSVSKLTIFRDITDIKILQGKLIRSDRLAAAGQLATSIAHEINSPLQGIASLIGVIKKSHEENDALMEDIALIEKGFKNIRHTVRNLLDLNRPGKEQQQFVNINTVIIDTLSLVKVLLKKNKITIDLNLSSRLPVIMASPQQLGHVFMNLINNAIEAITGSHKGEDRKKQMTAGGNILISTRIKNGKIEIEIADTGPGIQKNDMDQIFDPFYTRKKTMGIGVGLSICHGAIEDYGGSITVKNRTKGGAVFKITLPVN